MHPLLTASQIQAADQYTISHEPVPSIDLMERAAKAFTAAFTAEYGVDKPVSIYCGTGNNGGDGLAIARLLIELGYAVTVKIARFSERVSDDFNINLQRLKEKGFAVTGFNIAADANNDTAEIIIDALLGNGLNKPLSGEYAALVQQINDWQKTVVAVDVPTGFFGEGEIDKQAVTIKADLAITFQQPKINFLLPESKPIVKRWVAVDIGINQSFAAGLNATYQFIQRQDISRILKPRERFSNKGTYGHALVIAGQAETMGAALLCASACAQAGAGLTTACIPQSGLVALNSYMPEIMAVIREVDQLPHITWDKFRSITIGPGLGKGDAALALLTKTFNNARQPLVIDADALNLLAEHHYLWGCLPKGSILTPHMKEFDRLFGTHNSWWQRVLTASQKAAELGVYIVLKNDYTIIADPDKKIYFNSTGNPAMATGGMGDVLTGIITGLLAQKYTALEACLAAVYIHGEAGDELARQLMVVLPNRVVGQLPATMAAILKEK